MKVKQIEIEFGSDTSERKKFFRAASFAHPAKMVLPLQIYLIENYTKSGETILDPMAGSGTILIACTLGRNIICVELEQKFVAMQKANWQKIKAMGPMLGHKMGDCAILQGDARNLSGLMVDNCIFSPPFSSEQTTKSNKHTSTYEKKYGYATNYDKNNNIANLLYGEISAVISSPPYNAEPTTSESYKRIRTAIGRDITKPSQQYAKYSADTIISSPPYEKAQATIDDNYVSNHITGGKLSTHHVSAENIGNLKGETYLEAMFAVYQNCHAVLKDGGLMCLVTKNFIRDKKLVRLDLDTIKLCEQAGFTFVEQLKRKLTQQSFWRTIYYKKFPDAPKIEYEDILIFRK